jgi:hypothetical protein
MRRRHVLPGTEEVFEREIDDDGKREQGEHAVYRGQRDVQRNVAFGEVAIDICGSAARRGRDQHQAERVVGRELEPDRDQQCREGQEQDLQEQAKADREGIARHAAEVFPGQA